MTELVLVSNRIPEKFAKLKQVETAGLLIPKSLLLSFEGGDRSNDEAIQRFSNESLGSRFIVRSAHLSEDDGDLSLAGHFWSSGPVTSQQLSETIRQAQRENIAVLQSLIHTEIFDEAILPPPLVLQEYIEHDVGGVLFSPWSFFPDYAYVEYSESGVKNVVEGQGSRPSLLSLDSEQEDPLPLNTSQSHLRELLIELCCQLSEVFDFDVDCEWAFDTKAQLIKVLQVRPQTHRLGAILPFSKSLSSNKLFDEDDSYGNDLDEDKPVEENWQFTALSESLGKLSPLSFSLLQQLYEDSIPMFKQLGCKAKSADFMQLAPDGTILVDPRREKKFYSLTLLGGFKRGMQQAKLVSEAYAAFKQYVPPAPFSYETLQRLFADWMMANVFGAGAGRSNTQSVFIETPHHAYELSWPVELELPIAPESDTDNISYDLLNAWGRALFLFELNKLKQQIQSRNDAHHKGANEKNSYLFFNTWSEYKTNGFSAAAEEMAKARQHDLAPLALYDYALSATASSGDIQALSSTNTVEGVSFVIINPSSAKQSIFKDCILLAPYFDNRWVSQIRYMKGIVVNKGSQLSHSAIVAREYGVPYYVVADLNLAQIDQGQQIALDPKTLESWST